MVSSVVCAENSSLPVEYDFLLGEHESAVTRTAMLDFKSPHNYDANTFQHLHLQWEEHTSLSRHDSR
jgi:hypothetical protein